jgi:hypothetical protein
MTGHSVNLLGDNHVSQEFELYIVIDPVRHKQPLLANPLPMVCNHGVWPLVGNQKLTAALNVILQTVALVNMVTIERIGALKLAHLLRGAFLEERCSVQHGRMRHIFVRTWHLKGLDHLSSPASDLVCREPVSMDPVRFGLNVRTLVRDPGHLAKRGLYVICPRLSRITYNRIRTMGYRIDM